MVFTKELAYISKEFSLLFNQEKNFEDCKMVFSTKMPLMVSHDCRLGRYEKSPRRQTTEDICEVTQKNLKICLN